MDHDQDNIFFNLIWTEIVKDARSIALGNLFVCIVSFVSVSTMSFNEFIRIEEELSWR